MIISVRYLLSMTVLMGATMMACKSTDDMSQISTIRVADSSAKCSSQNLVTLVHNFNQDAWSFAPLAKSQQIAAMQASAAEFYRVTPYVYYALVQQQMQNDQAFANNISVAGVGQIYADLHPLNVAWQPQNGVPVAWVNDFDDTAKAPFAAEILRSVSSILVFAPQANANDVAASYLSAYNAARSGASSGNQGADLNIITALPATTDSEQSAVSQPNISKSALAMATFALQKAAPTSLRNIADCKASYKVYAGGSSNGLPRFRFKCGGSSYEIKAARGASWDTIATSGVNVNVAHNAARIVEGASALAASEAGQFYVADGLYGQSWAGPWNYYLHERVGNSFNLDNLSADNARSLAVVLGGLAGAGHKKAGAGPLNAKALNVLQGFVPSAAAALAEQMNNLQQTLPACL